MRSVLKAWVMDLGLREQGTLMTAIRGCDLSPKYPLDSPEKNVTAFIRCAVMVAFDPREIDAAKGCFMQTKLDQTFKLSSLEQYPLHWVIHVLHALEIIGYRSIEFEFAQQARAAYLKMVQALHLNPETVEEMAARLSEDRVKKGNIVGE